MYNYLIKSSHTRSLSIIADMYNEELINVEQRGMLKELILDNDEKLKNYLETFHRIDDRSILYSSILDLLSK